MIKKLLLFIFILVLSISIASFSEDNLNNQFECKIKLTDFNETEFNQFLESKNISLFNSFNQKANYIIYNYFNEIVYLNDEDINQVFNENNNRRKESGLLGDYLTADGNWEWEWIGYTLNGEKAYNQDFPPDYKDTDFINYNYTPVSGALESWERLDPYEGLTEYILTTDLYHEDQLLGFQLNDHIIENVEENVLVQSIPGLFTDGTLKVEKDWGTYYATFAIQGFGGNSNIKSNLIVDKNTFEVQEDESLDINLRVDHVITLEDEAKLKHLKCLTNKIYKNNNVLIDKTINTLDSNQFSSEYDFTIDSDELDYGINTFTIKLETQLETIFGDIDSLKSFGNTYSEDQIEIEVVKYKESNLQAILEMKSNHYEIEEDLPAEIRLTLDGTQSIVSNDGIESIEFYINDTIIDTITNDEGLLKENLILEINREIFENNQEIVGKIKIFDEETNQYSEDEQKILITKAGEENNHKPIVNIYADDYAVLDESTDIKVNAYDLDDDLVEVIDSSHELNLGENSLRFNTLGVQNIYVDVQDEKGLTNSDRTSIEVIKPLPRAYFKKIGKTKEHHTVTFDGSVSDNKFDQYPIDWSKTQWSIEPFENIQQDDIYYEISNDQKKIDATFNDTGIVEVKIRVYNTLGYSTDYSNKYVVQSDLPPQSDFDIQQKYLRDPLNDNNATIQIYDQSSSPDDDYLTKRIYKITHDQDNNGIYDENGVVYIENQGFVGEDLIDKTDYVNLNSGNSKKVIFQTDKIGSYQVELIVIENHDNRLLEFIDQEHILTDSKVKKTKVINIAPVSNLNLNINTQEKINLIVLTDYKNEDLLNLSTQLNKLKVDLDRIGKSLNINVINDEKIIGTQSVETTKREYARYIDYSYKKNGYEYLWTTNDGLVQNETVDEYVNGEIIYEKILSSELPQKEEFVKSKTIRCSISEQEEVNETETSQRLEKFYRKSFFDPDNKSNTLISKDFTYYLEDLTPDTTEFNNYDQQIMMDSLTFDYVRTNFWTHTGNTVVSEEHNAVVGIDYDEIFNEQYDQSDRNILLLIGNGKDFNTNNQTKNYYFGSLNSPLNDYILENNFETYAAVPKEIYSFKYDNNQYNTTINSQQFSIEELINASPIRGKKLSIDSWQEGLGFLKNINSKIIETVETINNQIQITLDSVNINESYKVNYFQEDFKILGENNSEINSFNVANILIDEHKILPIENGFYLQALPPKKVYHAIDHVFFLNNHLIVKLKNQKYKIYGYFENENNRQNFHDYIEHKDIKDIEYIYNGELLKIIFADNTCKTFKIKNSNFDKNIFIEHIKQVKILPNDYDRFSIFKLNDNGTIALDYYLYDNAPISRESIEEELNSKISSQGDIKFIDSIKNDYLIALYDHGKIFIKDYYNNDLSEDDQLIVTDHYLDDDYVQFFILKDFIIGKDFNNELNIVAYKNKYKSSEMKNQLETDLTTDFIKIWDTFNNNIIVTNAFNEVQVIGQNNTDEDLVEFLNNQAFKNIYSSESNAMIIGEDNQMKFLFNDAIQTLINEDDELFEIKNINNKNKIFFDHDKNYFYKIFKEKYIPEISEKAIGFQPITSGQIVDVSAGDYIGLAKLNNNNELINFSIRKGIHNEK